MTLLLKQLDIHGFKSFATPTTFVFDRGITAIIGPNGSGKSNVAEALRWVLGEQGHANLRSRRTEDVIFAGSDKRSQLGLAEVTLTLDNSDGDLPLPFAEITVSRRAFRSGENQYLINGGRVRLKDVHQLVAPLGQSYTIIGQGLVDAALSQRPEERRGLFEHAAGISGLRLQANDAERSLNETANNAQRLRDILGELEPRVRSLERQARLAREYGTVRDRLHDLQRRRYAALWAETDERLACAQQGLLNANAHHQEQETIHERALRSLSQIRAEDRRLSTDIHELTERLAAEERALASERHRLELFDTRARAADERVRDLATVLDELAEQRDEAQAAATAVADEACVLREHIDELRGMLEQSERRLRQARAERAARVDSISAIEQSIVNVVRRIAELDGQRTATQERRSMLESELQSAAATLRHAHERASDLQSEIKRATDSIHQMDVQVAQQERSLATIEQEQTTNSARLESIRADIRDREQELAQHRSRLEILQRIYASGEGLYAGVRSLLRAVRQGSLVLPGLIGTVAETIEVPTNLETAIEVALGGHLQDIVVEHWSDAQAAIDYLQRGNLGRATFQPLDTVRPFRRQHLECHDAALVGIAADIVTYDARVERVIQQLLGRTLVVSDLTASRRVLNQTSGWTIVTLSGEITRPSGAVTGGGKAAESGLLARERERRLLPSRIDELGRELDRWREDEDREVLRARDLSASASTCRTTLTEMLHGRETAIGSLERAHRDLAAVMTSVERENERQRALSAQLAGITEHETTIGQHVGELSEKRDVLNNERHRLQKELDALPVDNDESTAADRSELAASVERLDALNRRERDMWDRHGAAERAIATRSAELDRLRHQTSDESIQREAIVATITDLEQTLASSREGVLPLAQQREALKRTIATTEREVDTCTENVREAERDRDRATLQLARVQDERGFLLERIRSDLDIEDPSLLAAQHDETVPPPDEQEISRLRERLRRMSVVSDDVLEQYEDESQRLGFMSQQLADVDQAMLGLRKVLSELNAQMATRFASTFHDVAIAFEQTFSRLFGGGTARLVMNDGDDTASGIDIVAQPPGKRLQNLNALSGGERALTAVALLIAIQRVNPSPFCLLDEVDAALDESNVLRFRDEIRDLAQTTQFVLITHNRGTIEGADTLYGVTMGDDGISRILSLRLDDAIRAVEEYEQVESAS